jgi:predicted esterase
MDPVEGRTPVSHAVVPASNFGGDGPAPVGSYQGMGPYGTYDMAGNVKEWVWNESSAGRRISLGGGWSEPVYMFHLADPAAPMTREPEQGFRCMRIDGEIPQAVAGPLAPRSFDPRDQKPVSDEVFAILARRGAYEPRPLEAVVEHREDHPEWTRERVTFAAAYDEERVIAHLFLPKTAAPPFQAILYWPGVGANILRSSEQLDEFRLLLGDFVRTGRAVVYPVYRGTYERGPNPPDPDPGLKQLQDLARTIEYLKTRPDIDTERLAYLGLSWGAGMGAHLTPEERYPFKAAVLISGGFWADPLPPERSQVNYAPRVEIPVLMINGRYDPFYPTETHAKPLFELFGAAPEHKRLALTDGGHFNFPVSFFLRESLDWLDRYLGPVAKTAPGAGDDTGGSY